VPLCRRLAAPDDEKNAHMTTVGSRDVVMSKRTARSYKEDDRLAIDSSNRPSRRSSGDDTNIEIIMEKDSTIRASSAPAQLKEGSNRVNEVGIEAFGGEVAIAPRTTLSEKMPLSPLPNTKQQPLNFGVVVPGVYRCSHPTANDYEFIKELGLKSVVSLVKADEIEAGFTKFMTANNIRHHIIGMRGTKKEAIPLITMKSILQVVLDQQNYPILLHCSHGKHRTGCVVGVVRKVSGWHLPNILDEYKSYASPKVRDCDLQYISAFQASDLTRAPMPKTLVKVGDAPFRIRGFFRTLAFTAVVLVIWVLSSIRISSRQPIEMSTS
jgi:tyrosine-protein phosphatase SIW14